jgi:hypothetical protein
VISPRCCTLVRPGTSASTTPPEPSAPLKALASAVAAGADLDEIVPTYLAGANAYYDSRRDSYVRGFSEFNEAVKALSAEPRILALFGVQKVPRLVLQFIYSLFIPLTADENFDSSFDQTWADLSSELETDTWTTYAVANLTSFTADEERVYEVVASNVEIRGRSFEYWSMSSAGRNDGWSFSRKTGWMDLHLARL